ncbi:hypothetical protein Mgra_00003329 [Meloidogyne graminicola]|uniref:Uncharacterized protein n=1 Tax=Meloidogyne graminicola TaxID=189291 RepID=A0A8S9ZVB6_9BILA|nr:hypothetical protein Mgra_00003329 [Meloidogyne graminicola]
MCIIERKYVNVITHLNKTPNSINFLTKSLKANSSESAVLSTINLAQSKKKFTKIPIRTFAITLNMNS